MRILSILLYCSLIVTLCPLSVFAAQESSTEVSLSIGGYTFDLNGYSSPFAEVTIEGNGIYDRTTADASGYFAFTNGFSPFSPREACLTAKDQLGRISQPVCLAPFPVNYHVSIGPVLLPPTVSLDNANYFTGDQIVLSGQAIPKTTVSLSLFTDQTATHLLSLLDFHLVKPSYAFSIPQLDTKTDSAGNFSITLPSSKAYKYRLFTQADFKENVSPKSTILNVSVLPFWIIIIQFFILLWNLVRDRILEILIMGELVGVALYIWTRVLHPHKITTLVLRQKMALKKALY